MRIAVFTWQDLMHPRAGGAERHLHEILRRLVLAGDQVTLVVAGTGSLHDSEAIDGVAIRRLRPWWLFPLLAQRVARQMAGAGEVDVFIEDIHKPPLFLTVVVRPVYVMIPHLMGRTAFNAGPAMLALLLVASERLIPRAYRASHFQALSASTAEELRQRGVARARIHVVPPGVDGQFYHPDESRRAATPLIVYVGRLAGYKNVQSVVHAFRLVHASCGHSQLVIVGTGRERSELAALTHALGVEAAVTFADHVTDTEKRDLLQRAWMTVQPSRKEGWGLTVLESTACGTPVIASNVPGLRDAVLPGVNGYLVPFDDVSGMSEHILRLIRSSTLRADLAVSSRQHALMFTWDETAKRTRRALEDACAHTGPEATPG